MAAKSPSSQALYQPTHRLDILHVPGLGRLLRWRWGRLVFQLPLLLAALLVIYDGLTGPQLAPQNIATVAAWVHYRGLVILALLLAGNLFCMSCPFTLPRTLARRLSGRDRRWPRALRSKWLAIVCLAAMFWAYEVFDLWASPWLTAWVVIGYFIAAFALEAIFAESPFCKYICPLGTFNFVASTVSPLQVMARSQDVCRTCVGKECVTGTSQGSRGNGSVTVLGCGTELFVPQIKSNLDCVFCLDCARACPHDNVALAARKPLIELTSDAWPRRWDVAFLALVFAFAAVGNAFGMVPPVYTLETRLAELLGTGSEALILLIIFGTILFVLPAAFGIGAAWLSRQADAAHRTTPLRVVFARYAPVVVPLGFGIWFAHYWFHFASGALSLVPVAQSFLLDHGIALLGRQPAWMLGPIMPDSWLIVLELAGVLVGLLASLLVLSRKASAASHDERTARKVMLPWLALLILLALAAVAVFMLPMEMRGTAGLIGG